MTGCYVTGRSWSAEDLRRKSWDDLHKLWYVLLKERNLLLSERDRFRAIRQIMPNGRRITKVSHSPSCIDYYKHAPLDGQKYTILPAVPMTLICTLSSLKSSKRPHRLQVRKSMCRIKYVLYARARAETDVAKSTVLKQFVKGL